MNDNALPDGPSRRRPWPTLAVALVLGVGGFVAGRWTAEAPEEVAAREFCALGDDDGASLLEIAGWTKAAERAHDDWDAVLNAIDDRCRAWRLRVALKFEDIDL